MFGKDASFVAVADLHRRRRADQGQHRVHAAATSNTALTLALNVNYVDVPERRVLFVEPSQGEPTASTTSSACRKPSSTTTSATSPTATTSTRVRVGIQPFQSDFRGFLFNDQQLGVRLFGNRDNNRFQYNLAAFWRLEKDTNCGLNDIAADAARRLDAASPTSTARISRSSA